MALPVRVSREPSYGPSELTRWGWPEPLLDRLFAAASPFGVDVREDADHLYVEADLPGFTKDEVDVTLDAGTLTITAEKRQEPAGGTDQAQRDQGQYLLRERRYERYQRSFTLPQNVDEQSVNAKLENGCLTVTLNKTERSKAKKIPLA